MLNDLVVLEDLDSRLSCLLIAQPGPHMINSFSEDKNGWSLAVLLHRALMSLMKILSAHMSTQFG
jgi:hypothetical protein